MSDVSSSPTRRSLLAGSAAVGAASLLAARLAMAAAPGAPPGQASNAVEKSMATTEANAIRPFRFNASPVPVQRVR